MKTDHEVTPEQRAVINSLVEEAVAIAIGDNEGIASPEALTAYATSPLAAEIFRTLLSCHQDNKRSRLQKEMMEQYPVTAQAAVPMLPYNVI